MASSSPVVFNSSVPPNEHTPGGNGSDGSDCTVSRAPSVSDNQHHSPPGSQDSRSVLSTPRAEWINESATDGDELTASIMDTATEGSYDDVSIGGMSTTTHHGSHPTAAGSSLDDALRRELFCQKAINGGLKNGLAKIQDSVDTGISALESAFKEAQAQHQKDMASANAKLDQVMAIFLEYVKHSKGALADLEASLASIRADVRNAQASMANVQASVANVQASVANVQASVANAQASTANAQASTTNVQASMTNIQAGVASVQVNMAQVAQRIERLEGATHRIEDDIRDTRQSTPSVCSNTADVQALMMLRAYENSSDTTPREPRDLTASVQASAPGPGTAIDTPRASSGEAEVRFAPFSLSHVQRTLAQMQQIFGSQQPPSEAGSSLGDDTPDVHGDGDGGDGNGVGDDDDDDDDDRSSVGSSAASSVGPSAGSSSGSTAVGEGTGCVAGPSSASGGAASSKRAVDEAQAGSSADQTDDKRPPKRIRTSRISRRASSQG